MSLPIKIVEDSNQSPDKNISIYQSNQANENQNLQNYFFHQSNQINNPFSSLILNKSSNISTQSNISSINNENFYKIKESKKQGFESFNIISKSNIIKSNDNYFNNISNEETIEQKNVDQPEARPCFYPIESVDKKNDIKDMDIENLNNDYSNQFINKNNISQSFNNCPHKNKNNKINEIKEYFQSLKEYSDKIVNILRSIYKKNEYLMKSSQELKSNNSEMDIGNKLKINKDLKKELIININVNIKNKNATDLKEEEVEKNVSTSKIKSKSIEKENTIKPILNISKSKTIFKHKKHEIKDDNNVNNNNITHICKVKNFKRINNRKFNIKARGLRYNILTEEMKKQLLLDAMNMRTIEVAKKYGISTRNVNRWKKKGIQRKKGSGRKFKDPRLEKKILEWYKMQDKETLTSRQFKEKAIELSENKTFRASSGWLTNMKRKYTLNFKKY